MIYMVLVFSILSGNPGKVSIFKANVSYSVCEAVASSLRLEDKVDSVDCYYIPKKTQNKAKVLKKKAD